LKPIGLRRVGELEMKTNRTPHPNVDTLKATIRTKWDNMSEKLLINFCKAFRRRVGAVMKLKEATSSESARKDPAYKFC
ncbi:Uncharacterized protein FKW44_022674, partial [Caligus rogercresseyi]